MYSFFTIHDSICLFNVHIVLCAVCDSKIMFRKLRPISLSPHALSRHFHQWNQKVQIPQWFHNLQRHAKKRFLEEPSDCNVKRGQLFFLSCLSFVLELYNFWYRINNLTNISISKTGLFAFNLFFFFFTVSSCSAALKTDIWYMRLWYIEGVRTNEEPVWQDTIEAGKHPRGWYGREVWVSDQ